MSLPGRFPDDDVRIASPGDLAALLTVLRGLVRSGRLVELDPSDAGLVPLRLVSVPIDGPWPDVIDLRFAAPGGRRYRLLVETFHGAGGTWSAEREPDGGMSA